MEKNDYLLLNRIYQDCEVGMQSIDKVLKKIENETLKNQFKTQFDAYEKILNRADALAMSSNKELKDNNVFKKIKQTIMIYLALWKDKTPRHIVEMMIQGTVMGIVDTIKAGKDLKTKNEDISKLFDDFLKMQEDFYGKLKKQLSKV